MGDAIEKEKPRSVTTQTLQIAEELADALDNAAATRDDTRLPKKLRIAAAKHHIDLANRAADIVLTLPQSNQPKQ